MASSSKKNPINLMPITLKIAKTSRCYEDRLISSLRELNHHRSQSRETPQTAPHSQTTGLIQSRETTVRPEAQPNSRHRSKAKSSPTTSCTKGTPDTMSHSKDKSTSHHRCLAFPEIPAGWMRSDAGDGEVEAMQTPFASSFWISLCCRRLFWLVVLAGDAARPVQPSSGIELGT
ncbi:hypothetical protein Nepgr_006557 [Nepenthes gracilis]|uniref:Uncharacterized protein n=1 Tax=Nepenthes gracilis TaxID=150966 RepID=A0AAD3S593_NEPGR|nr:hypothetical protein Nepgr_006557 [Nepenthes gracilis]